jgi:uncharacterized protein (TIGR02145 family)
MVEFRSLIKNILTGAFIHLLGVSILSGQTLLFEDFGAEQMPPAGWALEEAESQWTSSASSVAGGESPEARFQWVDQTTTTRLISPEVDLSGMDVIHLQFRHMYDDYTGEGPVAGVATRSNGGTWHTVWEVFPEGNLGPGEIHLSIANEDVGASDFQFCFYLDGNLFNLDYWYLDDIRLFRTMEISIKLFLEGPYADGQMTNVLTQDNWLPNQQPFNGAPWYYYGPEEIDTLPEESIVDWILVGLWRHQPGSQPQYELVQEKAGFLHTHGMITSVDGGQPLSFNAAAEDSLRIWIHSRNHLSIMSYNYVPNNMEPKLLDFSRHCDVAFNGKYAMKKNSDGNWVVLSGDGNADGQINTGDKYEVWAGQAGNAGYLAGDFNLDGQVNNVDIDKYWELNINKMQWIPDTSGVPFFCGDTLLDDRDGESYTTVKIGSQCWMQENLNYEAGTSWCYDNVPGNCDLYGRLYNWNTIMNGEPASSSVPSGVQGICPEGWHVPSDTEWCILASYVDPSFVCDTIGYNGTDGAIKLKAISGWSSGGNGTNEFGFNALPGGCMGIYHFDDLFMFAYFWSTTESYPGFANLMKLNYGLPTIGRYFSQENRGYSLRCLKD